MSAKAPAGTMFGHPKGLFLLFATEMWERFSYYGMRALLVLSLVAGTTAANPGFGWDKASALRLYGIYTALVYFTPVLGGWLADNFIGQRRSVIIGGIVMAAGQFTLASSIPGNLSLFYVGLALLVVGNGFFKPNISTMVGDMYAEGDVRRDGAFTIFYMGINTGAFFAPLVCSTLGENAAWGWRFGYMAAGAGMLISVVVQLLLAKRYLGDIGLQPSAQNVVKRADGKHDPLTSDERDRLRVIFMLFVFVMLFWTAFEQAGGLMNLYAADKTNRFLTAAYEVPAGYFQSLNPMFIVLLGPVFAAVWLRLGKHGKNPATPVKMIFGLLLTSVGFLFMIAAVFDQQAHGKASMLWLVLAYLFHTMGELCISPVGLSMVTKLSPPRFASLMMGIWFLINFFANYLAGLIGSFAEKLGELNIFGGIAIVLAVFAVGLWALSGKLVDWMHGAEKIIETPAEPVLTEHAV